MPLGSHERMLPSRLSSGCIWTATVRACSCAVPMDMLQSPRHGKVHHQYRRKQQYCRVCPSPWVGAAGPVYRHCRRGVVLPGCDRRPRRFGFGWQVSQRHMHACDCGSARVVFDARARASHTTAIMRLRPRLAPRTWSAATKVASTVSAGGTRSTTGAAELDR